MPIYEFKCPACGGTVEVVCTYPQSREPKTCSCGEYMIRMVSRPSVRRNYNDWSNFGTQQFAEANARKCGVET